MKYKKVLSFLILTAASLFTFQAIAQSAASMSKAEFDRMDSSQAAYKRDQVQTQKTSDAEAISNAKADRVDTKAKAKESARIDGEAQDAAKQSKKSLRAEKKAQKQRKQADRQAEKAEAARDKSDLN